MSEREALLGEANLSRPPSDCDHERLRQISEHDVECIDCGLVQA
jgi:hypothetical protein